MNFFKNILIGLFYCAFLSCASESGGLELSSKNSIKISDCLAGYDYDYSRLLTKEDVLKHISVSDPSTIKMKYSDNKQMNAQEYGECSYQWPSDRPEMEIKISNITQSIPDVNNVTLSKLMFQEGSLEDIQERFQIAYKRLSAQEVEEMHVKLEKQFENKSEKELETAKGFIEARSKLNFEPLSGLGDMAYWTKATELGVDWGAELIVLVGRAKFTIKAKVSSDITDNLEIAKKMAEEVLVKCK